MKIMGKNKSNYLKIMGTLLVTFSATNVIANKLDDQSLAEQSVGVIKLAPIVIQAVKQDAQQSVDEQNQLHGKAAQQSADEAKKDLVYTTVLTDFEWQKKDPDPNKPDDKYLQPIQKYRLIDVRYNPYQRHDVRITTADSVTFWPGHEVDGVGFVK
ncbi:hypothetical protein BEN71_08415 [Acinetobacter wuhouensis]|uniref:Uncharacterized protein n=1 Tax=Acinetobacter wuhouensis TaxID=1879050 RepID=A0A385C342_9GAMM|nr:MULTISPECIES: hypothetical protein [Acinetobacter]AXQ22089.1 hypothetical protein BEN71_08415 [Acinetobacter wuhouensis]AYO54693.1 hypothetical protein CDG68_14010 [Acinetobacter wuhouensis]RZG46149.1 hypothetical protein EXU28_10270 [Acinetobacter wuhouensis]RZG71461.1 hypothetical protein EXU29_13615 [Acinetobacter wuhouensis]RZG76108.1 hypothetical protein EXE09_09305 [Acinetobacter sp. WCHAc060025]